MPAEPEEITPGAVRLDGRPPVPTRASRASRPRASYTECRDALDAVSPEPGAAKPDATLVVSGVRRAFGGLTAVDVVEVQVQRGVVTGLIGPNGAGKTTFFNLLTGFDRPDAGSWALDGRQLSGLPAHRVARAGLVRTFQLTKARANTVKALGLLDRFGLAAKKDDLAGEMSGGQRKLLEMARALMTDPAVLCLDEPMAGVNPALTQSILTHVKTLREEGLTIIFVEHDMDVIRDISDWVVAMAQGSIVAEGPPEAILRDSRVIDAYLGAHHDAPLTRDEEDAVLAEADASIGPEVQRG